MVDKTNIGIAGILLTLILGLGVVVQPDDTHYSDSLNITMHCERLSSTGLTCYPKSDTTKGKVYSSTIWLPIITDSVDYKQKKIVCYPEPRGCEK